MARTSERAFLDRPLARLIALLVFLAAAASLAWLHRADLWPEADRAMADDPFAICFAERAADIDRMRAEGVIDDQRAALFRTRAEAMCRAEAGGPGGPPLPGQ